MERSPEISTKVSSGTLIVRLQGDAGRRGRQEEVIDMKYLLLFYGTGDGPEPGTPEFMALAGEYMKADAAMQEAGVLQECKPLEPVDTATTVRVRDQETLLTDGPAAELKEQIGGYAIIDCADLDEATRWAATVPAARDACVEVRPIMEIPG